MRVRQNVIKIEVKPLWKCELKPFSMCTCESKENVYDRELLPYCCDNLEGKDMLAVRHPIAVKRS